MSAKKATKKTAVKLVTITMGMHKGRHGKVTRKKAPEGCAVVNIIDGPEITISKNLYK